MKKILVWLLVIMMGLSLLGCDIGTVIDGEVPVYDDGFIPDHFVDAGDPGIEDMPEITPAVAYWLERLPGEYAGNYFEQNELVRFTLNADKTCTIDGKNYTWDFQKKHNGEYICSDESAIMDVYDGNTAVYELSISVSPLGFFGLSVRNNNNSTDGIFYNTNEIVVVEFTLDNWLDYMEYVEYVTIYRDDSGKVDTVDISGVYQPKEEYGIFVPSYAPDVRIDYTPQVVRQKITFDPETETYEWGEVTEHLGPNSPMTDRMIDYSVYGRLDCYGFSFSQPRIEEFPEDEVAREVDVQMNSISGFVFLYPGN